MMRKGGEREKDTGEGNRRGEKIECIKVFFFLDNTLCFERKGGS